jgi:K+-sensing histidine kinase KdpD
MPLTLTQRRMDAKKPPQSKARRNGSTGGRLPETRRGGSAKPHGTDYNSPRVRIHRMSDRPFYYQRWFGYASAVLSIAIATAALKFFGRHINPTTVALVFLSIILIAARTWGSAPAVAGSLVGILSFNFLFLPPYGTFAIGDPDNWIAFIAFMVTAITVGQLSGSAKRRAEEAEGAKQEIERLYYELQDSFQRSSQAKALKQSERLKSALLDAVTHDFRTPLTSIKASATAMLDDLYATERDKAEPELDTEARKEMLQVIDEEADRLDRFVDGLTKLARIDAGDMRLHLTPASIDEIVAAALKRLTTYRRSSWTSMPSQARSTP